MRPIIVGGCHRSGTSLLRRLLNAHSRIHCGPEVKFFRDFYADYCDDALAHLRFSSTARALVPEPVALAILGRAFIEMHEHAARRNNKVRWADKCPENVLYLNAWQTLLGDDWAFVYMMRDPVDVIASMEQARFDLTIPVSLEERIEFYVRYSDAAKRFARRYPQRSYAVRYESLVKEPVSELGRLMEWLGETLECVQLAFNSAFHEPGLEDPKVAFGNDVHNNSVGRGKASLSADTIETIQERTREVWPGELRAIGSV